MSMCKRKSNNKSPIEEIIQDDGEIIENVIDTVTETLNDKEPVEADTLEEILRNKIFSIIEKNNDSELYPQNMIEMIKNINDIKELEDILYLLGIKQETEMNNIECHQTDGIPMKNVEQTFEKTNELVSGTNSVHTITLESDHSPTIKIVGFFSNPVIICELLTKDSRFDIDKIINNKKFKKLPIGIFLCFKGILTCGEFEREGYLPVYLDDYKIAKVTFHDEAGNELLTIN